MDEVRLMFQYPCLHDLLRVPDVECILYVLNHVGWISPYVVFVMRCKLISLLQYYIVVKHIYLILSSWLILLTLRGYK